jgi:hypothetical protein
MEWSKKRQRQRERLRLEDSEVKSVASAVRVRRETIGKGYGVMRRTAKREHSGGTHVEDAQVLQFTDGIGKSSETIVVDVKINQTGEDKAERLWK